MGVDKNISTKRAIAMLAKNGIEVDGAEAIKAVIDAKGIFFFYPLGEMLKAQSKEQFVSGSDWEELIRYIKEQRFPFAVNVDKAPDWRNEGKMGQMKRAWEDILNAVTAQSGIDIESVTARLSQLLAKACKISANELPPKKIRRLVKWRILCCLLNSIVLSLRVVLYIVMAECNCLIMSSV